MADHALILASGLALAVTATMLIAMIRNTFLPQSFGSVGWHGGKKKR